MRQSFGFVRVAGLAAGELSLNTDWRIENRASRVRDNAIGRIHVYTLDC